MKKNLRFVLALAMGWLASSTAFAITPVDGVYKIGSSQDWAEFCALHNDGSDQQLNAELTADIAVEGNAMVGINGGGKPFRGTFDGKGHKLTINYNLDEERVAPFRRVNGATIKNLIVEGTINTSSKLAGGVVGGLWQSGTTIQNCVSYVIITDGNGGDATHGGICGSFEDVNGSNTIENCAFFGQINAPNREGCGGIVGWTNNNNNNNYIKNCLVDASGFNVMQGSNNDIICRNNGNVLNCYYVGSIEGMKNDKGATAATAEQAAIGELCFLLNGSQSTEPAWFQTLGTDLMPSPIGTDVVYAIGGLKCDGTPKGDVTYSNTEGTAQQDDHQWNDWGFCVVCDAMQPDYLTPDADGCYPIADKKAYNWFMMLVNTVDGHVNAHLTADLDLSDYNFIPMGTDASKFSGIFDGQGHRILNMTLDGTKKEQGLFSVCAGGTIIRNLIIDSSCKMQGTGGANVAALVGCINGDAYGDVVTIENVGNEMSFDVTTTNNAGFVARDWSGNLKVAIRNCYNTGNIMGGVENGAFTAWTPRVSLTNCWNTGRIEKTGGYDGSKSLARGNQPQFVNSYDLNSENTDNAGAPEGYEETWLASGRLCYVMNNMKSQDVNWYQLIGTDSYPLPFGTAIVYANGNLECDGITPVEGSELTFSNTEGSSIADHEWTEWGFCDNCGSLQPDFLTANAEGFFELETDKQLNWFAFYTNMVDGSANAVLVADIDMGDITSFVGIGSPAMPFCGVFDGQQHIISNLVIDKQDNENPAGFFNEATAGAVIRNFTLDNTCYIVGHHFVGAFVGHVAGNGNVLLQQLGNEADVVAWNQNAGGIVGCNTSGELKLTLENCYNAGTISGALESGGISGWLGNDAKTINCYNMGTVQGDGSESFARGNNIQITNCFDPVTNWPALPASPIEDFTNGVVYAALSEAAPGIWFLSAEVDGHPVLYDSGITTGISDVQHSSFNAQRIYDLQGRRVNAQRLPKGLYIVNGKKQLVR